MTSVIFCWAHDWKYVWQCVQLQVSTGKGSHTVIKPVSVSWALLSSHSPNICFFFPSCSVLASVQRMQSQVVSLWGETPARHGAGDKRCSISSVVPICWFWPIPLDHNTVLARHEHICTTARPLCTGLFFKYCQKHFKMGMETELLSLDSGMVKTLRKDNPMTFAFPQMLFRAIP